MNAQEVIARFRLMGPQDPNVLYTFFADHAREFTLMSGDYLHEPLHWSLFFRELAVESHTIPSFDEVPSPPALELRTALQTTRTPQVRWPTEPACPDCDHVHEGRGECGHYLGEEKFCHCPSKVSA